MVGWDGIEPPTPGFSDWSIQHVSYRPCAGMRSSAVELGTVWAQTERLLLNHLIRAEQTRNGASGNPAGFSFC